MDASGLYDTLRDERHYTSATILYVGGVFLCISILHTSYVYFRFERVILGVPFTNPRISVPAFYTIPGDIAHSIIAYALFSQLLARYPVPTDMTRIDAFSLAGRFTLSSVLLLFLGQVISGASWSKFALQAIVLVLFVYLLTAPVENPRIKSTILFYISISITLVGIGITWLELWAGGITSSRSPSTAYFITSSILAVAPAVTLTLMWVEPNSGE